jgi:hypothetical protein
MWNVSGTYFEACNCEAACPCVFLGPPTTGECTALVAWHVDDGAHDGTDLSGLNVGLAIHSPGPMTEGGWRAAVYLDDQASEAQAGALGAVFSGAAGGHPAVLASFIGEVMGVASAPMTFESDDAGCAMRIGDVADVRISAIAGQGDARVTVANHPLAVAPGFEIVTSRSDHLRYADHGYKWELSGRNGFFSPFAYEG